MAIRGRSMCLAVRVTLHCVATPYLGLSGSETTGQRRLLAMRGKYCSTRWATVCRFDWAYRPSGPAGEEILRDGAEIASLASSCASLDVCAGARCYRARIQRRENRDGLGQTTACGGHCEFGPKVWGNHHQQTAGRDSPSLTARSVKTRNGAAQKKHT